MTDCTTTNGMACPPPSTWSACRPWDITNDNNTNCMMDSLNQEGLDIAGAHLKVYRLLGVHEQTKLIDLTGMGTALSGGSKPNYPAKNAFTAFKDHWKSLQSGAVDIIASSYIGYDFGVVRLPNGRARYAIPANVRHEITTIKIKQSSVATQRVTKARIERSDDNVTWYGVAIVNLPDDDKLNTISFKQSTPSRYWRIRPLTFTGGDCDNWVVYSLEMHEYAFTDLTNIQDKILMENRDRDYDTVGVDIRAYYELVSLASGLSKMMLAPDMQTTQYVIRVNFNSVIAAMNRPIIIGDIIEIPNLAQYNTKLERISCFLEVTDVTWDTGSFTPGWQPLMLSITASPAVASQETQDIFGDLAIHKVDDLSITNDGNSKTYQDYSNIDQTIRAESNTLVPERGTEGSNTVREFTEEEMQQMQPDSKPGVEKTQIARTALYIEDGIPPNGAPYTEGPEFPSGPLNGAYHRLKYDGTAVDVPIRLFRYSSSKSKWIYLETDRRKAYTNQKALLEEYTNTSKNTNRVSPGDIK